MVISDPPTELLDWLNANIDVHRVLWIAVQLRADWAVDEIFRDEPEIVQQVIGLKLIFHSKDSQSYEFTDKGCQELGRWFVSVYRRRGKPGFQENWKRVTGRDH